MCGVADRLILLLQRCAQEGEMKLPQLCPRGTLSCGLKARCQADPGAEQHR